MEGRAIARPNLLVGGPAAPAAAGLQWRAGQLPGQTATSTTTATSPWTCFNGGPGNCPAKRLVLSRGEDRGRVASMEGRAIARPNEDHPGAGEAVGVLRFNGGPGNCPAKPVPLAGHHRGFVDASMEGRAIARPNVVPGLGPAARADLASMEGRAIARPNKS